MIYCFYCILYNVILVCGIDPLVFVFCVNRVFMCLCYDPSIIWSVAVSFSSAKKCKKMKQNNHKNNNGASHAALVLL